MSATVPTSQTLARSRVRLALAFLPAVFFALLYGALMHWLFQSVLAGITGTLSIAFILLVPFVTGLLAVYLAPPEYRTSWPGALVLSVLAITAGALLAALLLWEAAICVAMALPIMVVMSAVGGLAMWWIKRRAGGGAGPALPALLLFLPFLFIPIERQLPLEDSFTTVETRITINADAETVWRNIVQVAPIQPEERTFSLLFTVFGAPVPLRADMTGEGVGGIRRGQFAEGLAFIERITVWEPGRRIEWEITPDNAGALAAPWNQIGGRAFAVPHAAYVIESTGPDRVVLHLSSTHRLTTRFNPYGTLWTTWGMSEFQNQILQIIKARAEK